jgi:hypothetical protein
MIFKFSYLKDNYGIGFYLISLGLLYYTYNYQFVLKPCCDVTYYEIIAKHYIQNGLFSYHDQANLRLYGFPLILSIFYSIFGEEYSNLFYAIFVSFAYLILSIIIVNKLKIYINNYNIIHIAFAMNIFLFPYLTIHITDGISVLSWMCIFYFILLIIDNKDSKIILLSLFICSFIIGMSVMIRPSNVNLVLLLPILFGMSYIINQKLNKIIILILLILGFLIAIFPQIYINYIFFNKITFLPTIELGKLQIKWGIEYIKYATNLSGEGIPQLYYRNPFYTNSENLGLNWYFLNLGNGIKTIFLHLFNVFTYDYYFPYIYNLYPKYKSITLLYSWFILYYGIIGILQLYNKQNKDKLFKFLLYIVLPTIFLSTLSVLSISAVEVRFSLPLILILIPFAYLSFLDNFKKFKIWALFGLWIIFAYIITSFVDLQKNIPYM